MVGGLDREELLAFPGGILSGARAQAGGGKITVWTPELVFDRIKDAARVFRSLPDVESRFRLARSGSWPGYPTNPDEAFNYNTTTIRVSPSMELIDDANQAWEWLLWLSVDSRKIIFSLAAGMPAKKVARKLGLNRVTIWRMKKRGLAHISAVLNKN